MKPTPRTTLPATTSLFSWFGSNRSLAHHVGEALGDCKLVAIPFMGGGCELLYIKARTILANDLHRHSTNACRVMADPMMGAEMYRRLRRLPFAEDTLRAAQNRCIERESRHERLRGMFALAGEPLRVVPDLEWAVDYFVCSWLGRGGAAGKASEFRTGLSIRYDAAGGDSCTRYRSAVGGLPQWRKFVLGRCNFTTLDFRAFLALVKDAPENGVYCDPPFPDVGDVYRHTMSDTDHRELAHIATGYKAARVVMRFYDHPFVRELYPESAWSWRHLTGGKKQSNVPGPEVLLTRN